MSNKYANNHLISTHQGMIIPWGGGESAGSSTRGESFYHRINFNAVSFTHNTRAGFATSSLESPPKLAKSLNLANGVKTPKANHIKIWMAYGVFITENFNLFKQTLFYSGKLSPKSYYGILVKIRKDDIFLTAGKRQFGIYWNDYEDKALEKLFEQIIDLLNKLFESYGDNLNYSCDAVLLNFIPAFPQETLSNPQIVNLEKVKKVLPKQSLLQAKGGWGIFGGFTMEKKGFPLALKAVNGKVKLVGLETKIYCDSFLESFIAKAKAKDKNYLFNIKSKFYLVNSQGKDYIVITDKITNEITHKRAFNRMGNFISAVTDIKLTANNWRRKWGNTTINFKGEGWVTSLQRNIKFDSIKSDFRSKPATGLPNTNIGVLDLESYEAESKGYCYAIGFLTSLDDEVKTFYIDKTLDSNRLIVSCINELLRAKFKDTIFYVHNLGRFDAPFIIKALSDFNGTPEGIRSPFIFETITRNRDILKLTIKRKVGDKLRKVTIHDSLGILPASLKALGKDFNVKTQKDYFPYSFCKKETLFYIGETPDISHYKNLIDEEDYKICGNRPEEIEKVKAEKYKALYKKDWSLKSEAIAYLEKDLKSLYEVLVSFNKTLYMLFDVQMVENLTISGISMKIFLTKHYKGGDKGLPLINNRLYYKDIHSAYYGGRVEVYNPLVKDTLAYYYDVNSLYPASSLNPLPGLKGTFVEFVDILTSIDNLFGFFYCKVTTKERYLGLLPYRTEKSSLLFPVGSWTGWYFSEEIKFAVEHGYKVEILKGYNFNKSHNVFHDYVEEIYKIKSAPRNKSEKTVAKLLLNGLIGKFGMDFLKPVTKLLDKEKHNLILTTRELKNSIEIDDNLFLDSYIPSVDKDVCNLFNLDFVKVLNREGLDEDQKIVSYKSVSISTAAAVLAYARIHMAKLMLYILENGGKLYYSDTDSIVTDLKLPESLVHSMELGKLKVEHRLSEGYFIADKTYSFKTTDGLIVKRAKGVDSKALLYEDYGKMYRMEIIDYATKISSHRDYSLGGVTINIKNDVKLNPQFYSKRKRVFSGNPFNWIATKPQMIR